MTISISDAVAASLGCSAEEIAETAAVAAIGRNRKKLYTMFMMTGRSLFSVQIKYVLHFIAIYSMYHM